MNQEELVALSPKEWRDLDLQAFFDAHAPNCVRSLIGTLRWPLQKTALGSRYLEVDELVSALWIEGMPRLRRTKDRHPDHPPHERFKLLFGTLRTVAHGELKRQLNDFLPVPRPPRTGADHDAQNHRDLDDSLLHLSRAQSPFERIQTTYENTFRVDPVPDVLEEQLNAEALLLKRCEEVRSFLTPTQYRVLRLRLFDRMTFAEIGKTLGRSKDTVRTSFDAAASNLIAILPSNLQREHEAILPPRPRLRLCLQRSSEVLSDPDLTVLARFLGLRPTPIKPEQLSHAIVLRDWTILREPHCAYDLRTASWQTLHHHFPDLDTAHTLDTLDIAGVLFQAHGKDMTPKQRSAVRDIVLRQKCLHTVKAEAQSPHSLQRDLDAGLRVLDKKCPTHLRGSLTAFFSQYMAQHAPAPARVRPTTAPAPAVAAI